MMKGDLSTLKKVCKYGATVMLAGKIILSALIIILLIIGIGSFFTADMSNILHDWLNLDRSVDGLRYAASYLIELTILVIGLITVWEVHAIMDSAKNEYTPFIIDNADRIKKISLSFLVSSVVLFILELLADNGLKIALFMLFGTLLVSVVMYCLTIVVRYGVILQKESDETL